MAIVKKLERKLRSKKPNPRVQGGNANWLIGVKGLLDLLREWAGEKVVTSPSHYQTTIMGNIAQRWGLYFRHGSCQQLLHIVLSSRTAHLPLHVRLVELDQLSRIKDGSVVIGHLQCLLTLFLGPVVKDRGAWVDKQREPADVYVLWLMSIEKEKRLTFALVLPPLQPPC